jgi:hypothetical protein
VTLRARVVGPTDVDSSLPSVTRLHAPYPNPPGADGTVVRFDLVQGADVRIEVFDVAGRRVASLAQGPFAAGVHRAPWDGRDEQGRRLGAGVYFVRMVLPGRSPQSTRLALLR